jgi:hypothetical protein
MNISKDKASKNVTLHKNKKLCYQKPYKTH